jgi:translation initiation factor 2 alpha subunit (eIF-2alpha)
MKSKIKEDDFVICTVKNIDKTTVFVDIDIGGTGSIIFPEIAAGRIRNIREYAYPGKKIVCKVMKINTDDIELSLRRVTASERENCLKRYEKERNFTKMISSVISSPSQILEKIKEKFDIADFVDQAIKNPKVLSEFFSKEESEKIIKILSERKEKEKKVKKIITLSSSSPSGLKDIKETLTISSANINYLGSSQFLVECSSSNFKEAEKRLLLVLQEIEKKAKQKSLSLTIKEK